MPFQNFPRPSNIELQDDIYAANWTVPAGVTAAQFELGGARGNNEGRPGAVHKVTLAVTPGETFFMRWGRFWGGRGQLVASDRPGSPTIAIAPGGGSLGTVQFVSTSAPLSDGGLAGNGVAASGSTPGAGGVATGGVAASRVPGNGGSSASFASGGGHGAAAATATVSNSSTTQPVIVIVSSGVGGDGYAGGGSGAAYARVYGSGNRNGWGAAGAGGDGSVYSAVGTTNVETQWSNLGTVYFKVLWGASLNDPPNAVLLTSPTDGEVRASTDPVPFSGLFNDPNPGDTMTRWELEVRREGDVALVIDLDSSAPTISGWASALNGGIFSVTAPPGILDADVYEFRARAYDQGPLVGPWSSWRKFTLISPPDPPDIVVPTNGATITEAIIVTWTHATQQAYQLRRVNFVDNSIILYDSNVVESSTHQHLLAFSEDASHELIQVRVRVGGFWSGYASREITTDLTPPAVPTLVFQGSNEGGFGQLTVTHPTPVGDQPDVLFTELWVRVVSGRETSDRGTSGTNGIRIASDMATNYLDYGMASGVTYEFRVSAVADNGTATWSAWVIGRLDLLAMHIGRDGALWDNTAIFLGQERDKADPGARTGRYGRGRRRTIRRLGMDRVLSISIDECDQQQFWALYDKAGDTVCVRTPRGRKVWGHIAGLQGDEVNDRVVMAISFDVEETTHQEAV